MTDKFVAKFTKTGYVKYISHLDLLRVFKRAFKKVGLDLKYSQGFNPHPKMSFAQPLSLGYSSECELIEFETLRMHEESEIFDMFKGEMPEGIEILGVRGLSEGETGLAGKVCSAKYVITIPAEKAADELKELLTAYLAQPEIIAMKRMKKTKQEEPVNIKPMIRKIEIAAVEGKTVLTCELDSGSNSNLSPELIIKSFLKMSDFGVNRSEIEVERVEIGFYNNFHF